MIVRANVVIVSCMLLLSLLATQAYAAEDLVREPRCYKRCLKQGHYSNECDLICTVNTALGFPFNVAYKQFACYQTCYDNKDQTALACAFECRKAVENAIMSGKQARFSETITAVEATIDEEQDERESEIDARLSSQPIEGDEGPLIIE